MNWLLICVGIIFFVFIIAGIARGFIKIAVSLTATIITIVLVIFLTPHVGNMLKKVTPIDKMVRRECTKAMTPSLKDIDLSGVEIGGVDLGGVDLSSLGLSDEDLQEALKSVEIPRDLQTKAIEEASLPEIFKSGLLANNNTEMYKELNAKSFPDYVGAYLSKLIINIIAFLLTFLAVTIIVRIIMYAVGLIGELPILHGINRLAGGILGIGTALVVVWILFMVITLLYAAGIGTKCLDMVYDSKILTFLYESSPLMKWLTVVR